MPVRYKHLDITLSPEDMMIEKINQNIDYFSYINETLFEIHETHNQTVEEIFNSVCFEFPLLSIHFENYITQCMETISKILNASYYSYENILKNKLPSIKSIGTKNVINIDRNLEIDKHIILENTRNVLLEKLDESFGYESYINSTFLFVTFSKKNHILCIVDVFGNIYFMRETLVILLKKLENNIEEFKNKIRETLSICLEKINTYINLDFEDYKEDILNQSLIRTINEKVDNFSLEEFITLIKENMSELLLNELESNDKMTVELLCNKNTIYNNVLNKLKNKALAAERSGFLDGMSLAFRFYIALNDKGYKFDKSKKRWYKKVDIVPNKVYRNDKFYILKEEFRVYKVNYIFIDFDKIISGKQLNYVYVDKESHHPNISPRDNQVCLGTVLNKWDMIQDKNINEVTPFVELLDEIEGALQFVNFDSSYFTMRKDKLKVRESLKLCKEEKYVFDGSKDETQKKDLGRVF